MLQVAVHNTVDLKPSVPKVPVLMTSDYVEIRDEIISQVGRRNYNILLDGYSYWFDFRYWLDDEYCVFLAGSIDVHVECDKGDYWTPGYYRKWAVFHLEKWECRRQVNGLWQHVDDSRCFDVSEIDKVEYELDD